MATERNEHCGGEARRGPKDRNSKLEWLSQGPRVLEEGLTRAYRGLRLPLFVQKCNEKRVLCYIFNTFENVHLKCTVVYPLRTPFSDFLNTPLGLSAPPHQLGGLQKRSELPQWRPGRSLGRQELWCILGSLSKLSCSLTMQNCVCVGPYIGVQFNFHASHNSFKKIYPLENT